MVQKLILILLFFWCFPTTRAQEISKYSASDFKKDENYGWFNYIQLTGHYGENLDSYKIDKIAKDQFYGFGLRLGTQSTGRKNWQKYHQYPQYGLGVSYMRLGGEAADSIVGSPFSVYFFYGEPIVRFSGFRLNIDTEIGLSTGYKPYNVRSNPDQILIGAKINLHANFSLHLYYKLSDRLDIGTGMTFFHFSNGRIASPQSGIEMLGMNFTTAYHFNPLKNYTKNIDPNYQPNIRPTFDRSPKPEFKPNHEMIFMGSLGTVQMYPYKYRDEYARLDTTGAKGPRYMTNTFLVEYGFRFARKIRAVAGVDMFYDGSAENLYEGVPPQNVPFMDKTFYGYHFGIHYLIERVTFIFNYGRYIYKPFENRGDFWMRAGGRIKISDHWDINITLKTRNGGVADWIEWGMAYTIRSQ